MPLACKAVETLAVPACLELAQWYRSLAAKASATAKGAMLRRALAYYEAYLARHTGQDIDRLKARVALKQVQDELAKLGPAAASAVKKPTKQVDLLPMVSLQKHVIRGNWQQTDKGLAFRKGGGLSIPVRPEGDYELALTFVMAEPVAEFCYILPVRGSAIMKVVLEPPRGRVCIHHAAKKGTVGRTAAPMPALTAGREYALSMRILARGAKAGVTVRLDGKELLRWQGPITVLRQQPSPRVQLHPWKGEATFTGIRLTMLSGTAVRLK